MIKSLVLDPYLRGRPLATVLAEVAGAGFTGVELAYGPESLIRPDSTDTDLRALRRTLGEAGLRLVSLMGGIFWRVNFLSDVADERRQAQEHLRTMLRHAATLEIDAILVVPGLVGRSGAAEPLVADYDVAYYRAIEDLQRLAADAQRAGVAMAVENVWNRFLTSPVEMRDFVDRVGSPWVGVYFDIGNCLRVGYPEHWIRMLGQRIRRVHFKDYSLATGTIAGFVGLLEGDVNWPAVIVELRAIGYDGPATVEIGPSRHAPAHTLRQISAALDTILALPS